MKRIYFAIIFLIISISFAFFESYYVSTHTYNISTKIEYADNSMKENNFQKAYRTISEIQNEWEDKAWIVDIMLIHDYADTISIDLASMSSYAKNNNYDEYFSESETIKKQLASLKESELLSLENIL